VPINLQLHQQSHGLTNGNYRVYTPKPMPMPTTIPTHICKAMCALSKAMCALSKAMCALSKAMCALSKARVNVVVELRQKSGQVSIHSHQKLLFVCLFVYLQLE
jgi:hypothetical protein